MESKPIPIKQIAKDLSISSTTVSRALSGKGRVSEDTRNKIIWKSWRHSLLYTIVNTPTEKQKIF